MNKNFKEFCNKHYNSLLQIAETLTRDNRKAEEIVNDALLKYYRQLEKNNSTGQIIENPEGYIYRIIRNTFLDYIRKEKNMIDIDSNIDVYQLEISDNSDNDNTKLSIDEALNSINGPVKQKVAELRLKGKTSEEGAKILNMKLKTFQNRFSEAKKDLQNFAASFLTILLVLLITLSILN